MSMKELKDKLKAFRSEFGKPITKMTSEDMEKEIAHHESARKAAETKAKRLAALAKAREAKKAPPHLVVKEVKKAPAKAPVSAKTEKKAPVPAKTAKKAPAKAEEYSEASSTDNDSEDSYDGETIKKRIQKKD